ncbi:2-hydroxyacid dehydrogenase [Pontibacter burrus]|uniref:Glyoxylate/hydroxypyruvate reductase A n=1 Tax=Pontibacter burrus TaxID=2704466 RepID=A0A6B3LXD4_9BACT|nr:glyoxylate/hydroxypyruvate reductase A [Pontibacter burrus]NEM98084.1 glyoxylate/hydroxypyruvate reductase A [Pontibacter burrus]
MSIVIITAGKETIGWEKALKAKRPELEVLVHPDVAAKDKVEFALTWGHPLGVFKEYPNIRCIASMGAGVDHILRDPELPVSAIITKLEDPNLTRDMGLFVVALVLNHMRDLTFYKQNQQQHNWSHKRYLTTDNTTIGIMGMGTLGAHAAAELTKLGFKVNGWARTEKQLATIKVYKGAEELNSFLAKSDILICLLPLTSQTENILNRQTLSKLPKNAFVINVARGRHLVDEDLIALLDNGHLAGASLDVFREEPLPEDHPFWSHPKINITPHIASITDPASAVSQILDNYDRLQRREPLKNVVSPELGY